MSRWCFSVWARWVFTLGFSATTFYAPPSVAASPDELDSNCSDKLYVLAYQDEHLERRRQRMAANLLSRVGTDQLESAPAERYAPSAMGLEPAWLGKRIIPGGDFGPLQMDAVREEGAYIELSDFIGRPLLYKRVMKKGRGGIYELVRPANLDPATNHLLSPKPSIVSPHRIGSVVRPGDQTVLAKMLSTNQIGNSTTWEGGNATERAAMEAGLTRANVAMLELLASGRPLTEEAVNQWNFQINAPRPEQGLGPGVVQALGGVRRGSPPRFHREGDARFEVDMRRAEMDVNVMGDYDIPVSGAEKVGAKMSELLAEINAINDRTSFLDVVRFYRRFMFTHPYMDGCGLTGRVLLDYCLLKAGFPPSPKFNYDLKLVGFVSDEKAAQNLAGAF